MGAAGMRPRESTNFSNSLLQNSGLSSNGQCPASTSTTWTFEHSFCICLALLGAFCMGSFLPCVAKASPFASKLDPNPSSQNASVAGQNCLACLSLAGDRRYRHRTPRSQCLLFLSLTPASCRYIRQADTTASVTRSALFIFLLNRERIEGQKPTCRMRVCLAKRSPTR